MNEDPPIVSSPVSTGVPVTTPVTPLVQAPDDSYVEQLTTLHNDLDSVYTALIVLIAVVAALLGVLVVHSFAHGKGDN